MQAYHANGFFRTVTHVMTPVRDAMFAPYKSRVASRGGSLVPHLCRRNERSKTNYALITGPSFNDNLREVVIVGSTRDTDTHARTHAHTYTHGR